MSRLPTTLRLRTRTYQRMTETAAFMGISLNALLHVLLRWATVSDSAVSYFVWLRVMPLKAEERKAVKPVLIPEFRDILVDLSEEHTIAYTEVVEALWMAWQKWYPEYLPHQEGDEA